MLILYLEFLKLLKYCESFEVFGNRNIFIRSDLDKINIYDLIRFDFICLFLVLLVNVGLLNIVVFLFIFKE